MLCQISISFMPITIPSFFCTIFSLFCEKNIEIYFYSHQKQAKTGGALGDAAVHQVFDGSFLYGINVEFKIVCLTLCSMDRQVSYIVAVISEFAERFGLSNPQAYRYLARYKGIDFLQEFYDVEHTLSFENVVADVALYCRNNGGALA